MSLITVLNGCSGKSPDEIVSILNYSGWTPATDITPEVYRKNSRKEFVFIVYHERWYVAGRHVRLSVLPYGELAMTRYFIKPIEEYDRDQTLPPDPSAETVAEWNRLGLS